MRVSSLVVGVDIGTSVVKAVALDETGALCGSAQRPTSWTRPSPEHAEVTAAAVLGDVLGCVTALLEQVAASAGRLRVRGLGIAGLGESGFLLDRRGRPVAPAIAWFDPRGAEQMASLAPSVRDEFSSRTGLKVNAQCSLAKLMWLRSAGVGTGPGGCWLNIPEYVAHALGAARVTEPSLASRTALLDQGSGQPWVTALEAAGLTAAVLPPSVPAGRPCGTVTSPDAPAALRGAVVTVAGHDHCVAAVGAGALGPDQLFNSYGTADVLLRSVDGALDDAARRELVAAGVDAVRHALPGRSALVTGTRGGLLLQRTLQRLGRTDPPARDALDRSLPEERAGLPSPHVAVDLDDDGALVVTPAGGGRVPDATDVWQAALASATATAARRTAAVEAVAGPRTAALAAGGWTALRSVRAARRRAVPGIAFPPGVAEPGATGAALFAARAADGAGTPDPTTALDSAPEKEPISG